MQCVFAQCMTVTGGNYVKITTFHIFKNHVYVYGCLASMLVCVPRVPSAVGDQKRASDLLELEL